MLSKVVMVLGGMLLTFVMAVAVGLGLWAYGLNTQLGKVNAELHALQSTHEELNSSYSELNTDSAKAATELATAKSDIQSLKDQLQSVQAENTSHESKLSAIEAKVSILYAMQFSNKASIEAKIKASGDQELQALWTKADKSGADEDYWNLWDYVIQSVAEAVGLSVTSGTSVYSG